MMKRVIIALLTLCTLGVEGSSKARANKSRSAKKVDTTLSEYDAKRKLKYNYDNSEKVADFAVAFAEYAKAAKSEYGPVVGQHMIDQEIATIQEGYPDFRAEVVLKDVKSFEQKKEEKKGPIPNKKPEKNPTKTPEPVVVEEETEEETEGVDVTKFSVDVQDALKLEDVKTISDKAGDIAKTVKPSKLDASAKALKKAELKALLDRMKVLKATETAIAESGLEEKIESLG